MLSYTWINKELQNLADASENEGSYLSQANRKIHENLLSFFNVTGCVTNVEEACKKYESLLQKYPQHKNLYPSLRFPLEIDLTELQKISGRFLFQLLLNEPSMAYSIIHNVIYTYILSKLSLEDFQSQQLEIPLRIKPLNCLTICDMSCIPVGILTLIEGTLLSISTPSKYIRSYVMKCSVRSCQNSKGHRVSGALPAQMPLCYICNTVMQEAPESCEMGEQVLGLLVALPEFQRLNTIAVYRQAILVCIQDELMKGVEPGLEYSIAGQMGRKCFQAWTVHTKLCLIKEVDPHLIPPSIRKLQHDTEVICPNSPWTFVGSLASQIAACDYPGSCYFNLKMGLLLSLATQVPGIKPVPILAVGEDTHVAHRLMRYCAALRKRGAPLEWAGTSPGGQLRWEAHRPDGLGWIEAGPLLLAAGGVCCIGDWAKLKGKAAQAILSALESGYVFVESQSTNTMLSHNFHLQSSIWTYLLWKKNIKNIGFNNIKSLIQIFGIPFLATDEKNSDQMTFYTLQQHMKSLSPLTYVSATDFMEYLNLVTVKEVKISTAASQLIQKYFVASRRAQPNRLPVNAVSIITTLSEAYARLALQDIVQKEHVFAVLQLYEESLGYVHGPSVISAPPPTVLFSEMSISHWIHQTLQQFINWMEDFIHTFVGSTSQFC